MPAFIDRTGEKHFNNQGSKFEIIKYFKSKNCTIQFEDGTIVENVGYDNIKRGKVKNYSSKSIYNIGFIGQGKYPGTVEGKQTKCYVCWKAMLTRCYDNKFKKNHPTYKDVTVCEEWHNFQVFAVWYEDNYKEGFQLDKDILQKGNKIYSPLTCCFVPPEINSIFVKSNSIRGKLPIGVCKRRNGFRARLNKRGNELYIGIFKTPQEAFKAYKTAKEDYIKEMAEEYRNQITPQTYEALINYKVEITD